MKIVLLTTDTPHHRYFAWKLSEAYPLQAVVAETGGLTPPFEIHHPFETRRDEYEAHEWLGDRALPFSDAARTCVFDSANSTACVDCLRDLSPDVLLSFGTRKLKPSVFGCSAVASLNLHGGNPEEYRGLDTHLWAIYHNDFDNLVTTLHFLDEQLDTGRIVLSAQIPLFRGMELHQLRAENTRVCVSLVLTALKSLECFGWLPSRRQVRLGRYYSFMPREMKSVCLKKFNEHIQTI